MEKKDFLENYGLALKIERVRNKLTQEQLSEMVDCTAVHIGYIERGLKCPTLYQFLKIARALKINLNDFFKDFDIKKELD